MSFQTTRFSNLRENVSPELASLSDQRLSEALAANNIDAEAMEGFFDDLGRFAARAAPAILPIAGRVAGGLIGGPVGSAIGGSLGSLAGGAITSATGGARRPVPTRMPPRRPMRPPAPTIVAPMPIAPPPMVAPPPMAAPPPEMPPMVGTADPSSPPAPIDPGAGSTAANQLLQTITRPETLAALASMAMGSSGRTDIPVGGASIPVSAFSNLIGVLAGRADTEYSESIARAESALPDYMLNASGEARGDPAIEEHRASALYEFLNEAEWAEYAEQSESESEWESESSEFESSEYGESESEMDAAEMLELALELAESENE